MSDKQKGSKNWWYKFTWHGRPIRESTKPRKTDAQSECIFPAPTATGHIEKSTLTKQHKKALAGAKVEPFNLYTFRHTCLTRWAAFMDPYTLAYGA